jgi:hypothetical protein
MVGLLDFGAGEASSAVVVKARRCRARYAFEGYTEGSVFHPLRRPGRPNKLSGNNRKR